MNVHNTRAKTDRDYLQATASCGHPDCTQHHNDTPGYHLTHNPNATPLRKEPSPAWTTAINDLFTTHDPEWVAINMNVATPLAQAWANGTIIPTRTIAKHLADWTGNRTLITKHPGDTTYPTHTSDFIDALTPALNTFLQTHNNYLPLTINGITTTTLANELHRQSPYWHNQTRLPTLSILTQLNTILNTNLTTPWQHTLAMFTRTPTTSPAHQLWLARTTRGHNETQAAKTVGKPSKWWKQAEQHDPTIPINDLTKTLTTYQQTTQPLHPTPTCYTNPTPHPDL